MKKWRSRQTSLHHRILLTAVFLSGLASLMQEVTWAKLLVPLVGATAHAQAVVLAVFLGGLALGSILFGRWADRRGQLLQTYGVLEIAISVYCLCLPLILSIASHGYIYLAKTFFEWSSFKLFLRFALSFGVIAIPAILMGGTMPLLARHCIHRLDQTQTWVAKLYSINSFGAVLGVGLAGFILLPLGGIHLTLLWASLLNFLAGLLVYQQGNRKPHPSEITHGSQRVSEEPAQGLPTAPVYQPQQYQVTLVALAMSGFAAIGYEVIFTRIISLSFGSSSYSFTVMLMTFITGIALGSSLLSRLRVKQPLTLMGVCQLAVVASLLLVTPMVSRLPYWIGLLRVALHPLPFGFEMFQIAKAVLMLTVLLVPTVCIGFSFPLVAQIQARHPHQIGTYVGTTYAWNTMGNVLGALVTSLVLLPLVGLLTAFHLNLALNFIAGIALLCIGRTVKPAIRICAGIGAGTLILMYGMAGTGWAEPINYASGHLRLLEGPDDTLSEAERQRYPTANFAAWQKAYVLPPESEEVRYFAEDAHATVLVTKENGNQILSINSKPDASSTGDLDTQILVAHAPLMLNLDAQNVLVIGHGSGITVGSVLQHPVKQVDIVEISPAVLKADQLFAPYNHNALTDPRVKVYEEDAQSFLRTTPSTYDVIISEPTNPWISGVGNLFTVEFFEQARDRLNPGGVFTFWSQAYEQSDENVQLVFRTLGSVFPYVTVFGNHDLSDLVAVASMDPIEPDFAGMEQRFYDPAIRADMGRLGIPNLLAWLTHHRISQDRFSSLIPSGPLNTLARERLQYSAPRSLFYDQSSTFFDDHDPLVQGASIGSDLLLDRYITYRSGKSRPVSISEFEQALNYTASLPYYGREVTGSLLLRRFRFPKLPDS